MKLIATKDAVGQVLCHDMTQIIPGVTKDARFRKGHVVTEEDIAVLLSMGKENLYVWEKCPGLLHEDEAAERLLRLCRSDYMRATEPKEGKIELFTDIDGLFQVDTDRLFAVNDLEEVMIATRHGNTPVQVGDKLAGMRVIPLVIAEQRLLDAEAAAGTEPLLRLVPWKRKTAAVVTTGGEVAKGRIQDCFTPVLVDKLQAYGVEMVFHRIVGDCVEEICEAIHMARASGAQLLFCTGGMSVDPDDRTPGAIARSGAQIVRYGAPVLPGAMLLLGYFPDGTPILGLPGCVMYAKTTVLDLILPRVIADVTLTWQDFTALGHGGLCLGCRECRWPACYFGM